MGFQVYADVVLISDVPEANLRAGDFGMVIERHDGPGLSLGYTVEFFDMLGRTVAVVVLPGNSLRSPAHTDRPAVRSTG